MVRSLKFSLLGILFSVGAVSAQTCTPPPYGMVHWYTGDGNADDRLGLGQAVPQGAGFAAGEVGQGFSFNGVDQLVKLPAGVVPYPASGAQSTAPLSVDLWFKTTTGGVILGQQDVDAPATPAGWVPAIYVGTDGFLHAQLFWSANGVAPQTITSKKVNDGVFHHVAVVYDGSHQTLYLDGVATAGPAMVQTGYAAKYSYQLGTGYTLNWPAGNNGYYYFQGVIDEVAFFTRALSGAEVTATFNAGTAGRCKTASPDCISPVSGLTHWYAGDGNANDRTGLADGDLQHGAGFALGKVGLAFDLNGVNQTVQLPDGLIPYPASGATANAPLSFDAWFETTTGGVILSQQGTWDNTNSLPMGWVPAVYVGTDGYLYAEMFLGDGLVPISSAPKKVNDGAFHHVSVVYDGSTEFLYVDGVIAGSMALTQHGYTATYHYALGGGFASNWPATPNGFYYFRGLIDEVQFFNRALTQAEIQAIVNSPGGQCKTSAGACDAGPTSQLAASPSVLWPPDHQMVPVQITLAGQNCAPGGCKIVSVASNEPESADGDWVVTGDLTLELRADRLGKGDGRVYLVEVKCGDIVDEVKVTVPHDQRGGRDDQGMSDDQDE